MHFYVVGPRVKRPPRGAEYPCIVLEQDRWDDFGWKTQYHASYWPSTAESVELGPVKILQRNQEEVEFVTALDDYFPALDERHCSLGQERRYYEILTRMGEIGEAILSALRDVVFNPSIGKQFQREDAFGNSLLRFSEALDNFKTAGALFGHIPQAVERFSFDFVCRIRGFPTGHEVSLDFTRHGDLPHRLVAFVGRNGTGKTGVMSEMARQLSGVSNLRQQDTGFRPERPSFSRVIAISYSPFGPFRYPPRPTSSYRYCGLFDHKGRMGGLERRITEAIEAVQEQDRVPAWLEALKLAGLMANEPGLEEALGTPRIAKDVFDILKCLSSGHFYVAALLTEVTANLLNRSLLLIDEPELYLHPNMVAGLMRALDQLLEADRFDSYAVIATHSPMVIQELLGRSVRVFMRMEEDVFCVPLGFESFGENLTAITNEVFGVSQEDKNYMHILERLAAGRTPAAVERLFEGQLSLNASAFIRAIGNRARGGRP